MRNLLVAVADDPHSRLMFAWLLKEELKADDSLHILHVSMRDAAAGSLPGGDYFDQAHPHAAREMVQEMLHTQYVAPLTAAFPGVQHAVHIIHAAQDSNTVGRIICEKVEQLQADHVYLGGRAKHKSKLASLLSGSVLQYVEQHCKVPVTLVVQEGEGTSAELLSR